MLPDGEPHVNPIVDQQLYDILGIHIPAAATDHSPYTAAGYVGRMSATLSTGIGAEGPPDGSTTLPDWIGRLRNPDALHVPAIRAIRAINKATNRADYDAAKDALAWVTVSGYFFEGHRRKDSKMSHSGMVFTEVDNLLGRTPAETRDLIVQHPAVMAAWISAGAGGVHIAVAVDPIPQSHDDHTAAYLAVIEALNLPAVAETDDDKSAKNRNRISFISHDPDARIKAPDAPIAPITWEPIDTAPPPGLQPAAGSVTTSDQLWAMRSMTEPDAFGDTAMAIRFITDHKDRLVIAWDPHSLDSAGMGAVPYAVNEMGLLSAGATLGLLWRSTYQRAAQDIRHELNGEKILPRILAKLQTRFENGAKALPAIKDVLGIAISTVQAECPDADELLPPIHHPNDMDADYMVIGCANGLFSIPDWQLLPAARAARYLVTANTGIPFVDGATHKAVDKIAPPHIDDIASALGWMICHPPHRSAWAEVSPPRAGKTIRRQAITKALGDDYVGEIRSAALQRDRREGSGSHNGDHLEFARPRRLVYCPENPKAPDLPMANKLTGERTTVARDVGEKRARIVIGGHLIIQGNQGSTSGLLGVGGDGQESKAWRERLRTLPVDPIPEDDVDSSLPHVIDTDPTFPPAMLYRLLQYAYAMKDFGPDAPRTAEMDRRMESFKEDETPEWVTHLVDCVQPLDPATDVTTPPLNSEMVKAKIKGYCELTNEKSAPGPRTVTTTLKERFGDPLPTRQSVPSPADSAKKVKAWVWPNHQWTEPD